VGLDPGGPGGAAAASGTGAPRHLADRGAPSHW